MDSGFRPILGSPAPYPANFRRKCTLQNRRKNDRNPGRNYSGRVKIRVSENLRVRRSQKLVLRLKNVVFFSFFFSSSPAPLPISLFFFINTEQGVDNAEWGFENPFFSGFSTHRVARPFFENFFGEPAPIPRFQTF